MPPEAAPEGAKSGVSIAIFTKSKNLIFSKKMYIFFLRLNLGVGGLRGSVPEGVHIGSVIGNIYFLHVQKGPQMPASTLTLFPVSDPPPLIYL